MQNSNKNAQKQMVNTIIGGITGSITGTVGGALIGSAIIPGVGTVIGGLIGGVTSGISLGAAGAYLASKISTYSRKKNCLVVIDIQNDFCEGGAIPIKETDIVITKVNSIREKHKFDYVCLTQDSHPHNHISFAETHNSTPGSIVILESGKKQKLWPSHCVNGTYGFEFHPKLTIEKSFDILALMPSDIIIQKGSEKDVDSYSGFKNEKGERTPFHEILKDRDVQDLYVCGIALDYCVYKTCIDAIDLGYNVFLILDACRPASEEDAKSVVSIMVNRGVKVMISDEITLLK